MLNNQHKNLFLRIFIYLFMRDTHTERQRHRKREKKQAPCRQPDMGLDPGMQESHPELKADTQPLSHPGVPSNHFLPIHTFVCMRACMCVPVRRHVCMHTCIYVNFQFHKTIFTLGAPGWLSWWSVQLLISGTVSASPTLGCRDS